MIEKYMIDEKLLKPYNPEETEDRIYRIWEESGLFNPDTCIEKGVCEKNAQPFSMVLPPPNVTGMLHMGHAAMLAIEDILTRYHRMKGYKTLWLPGTDHAAIATQSKVESIIYKEEKKNRHDLGREVFLERVEKYAQESHDTIVHQIKKLGASIDWSREAYTLDEKRNFAVRTAFKKMYDDGLIYRKHKVVNWDPKGQTTVSDEEIEYKEVVGKLYTFKYSYDFPISISTTRPETKLGDTAVAVHPEDKRYNKFIGKEFDVSFAGTKLRIKIVGDLAVDPAYGTGAVGVTPAHSQTDSEIALRHDLPFVQVIDEYTRITINPYKGKKAKEAREMIVEWLRSEKLLEKEEDIKQNITVADRSGGIIEPLPKLQWFVNVNKKFKVERSRIDEIGDGDETTLKELMRKVVENKQITIIPDHFSKTYFHWIDNLHDWCISRQIWYGHRIPVWYKNGEIYCGVNPPMPNWQGEGWEQDPDTLDTWFSSGLWTFSTLGWPEKTEDLEMYHPTTILETGHDILFFWVARMILMTGYLLGDIPFKTVYLHGLVRDKNGKKMSKSLGNIIDPLDMIKKYGADAARMSFIVGNTPGTDMNLSEDKIKGYKHFANKIWNVTRFVLSNTENVNIEKKPALSERDQEILKELEVMTRDVTTDIENYRFYLAGEKLYQYFWKTFADVIIEESKKRILSNDTADALSCKWTLLKILSTTIIMLHPFIPFVTEEIWGMLPHKKDRLLMVESWPTPPHL
ncbi:MAG: valine--tRNA ligase [Candidatus Yonathbacteria bacterium]|nr:valine--tRNA ligase [Candidatus Yonathbacteria bacterium]